MKIPLRRLFFLLFFAAATLLQAPAHAQRMHTQAELDALLAPIALQQDGLLWQILDAATHPEEVQEAAQWSRSNPGLSGDAAVREVERYRWHPSVKALVGFPELLARMAESPRWLADLGDAFLTQQTQVMDTVQALRSRAHAAGNLQSDEARVVEQYGDTYVLRPSREVVYAPYYDPMVVYGPWWWPHYRPVYWSPWVGHAFVGGGAFFGHRHFHPRVQRPPVHGAPPVQRFPGVEFAGGRFRVPESRRQPIVQSAPTVRKPILQSAPTIQSQPAQAPQQRRLGGGRLGGFTERAR